LGGENGLVLELQLECKAEIVLVVQQNWFRGLANELHVVLIVSQVPENVCKQSRKTVMKMSPE